MPPEARGSRQGATCRAAGVSDSGVGGTWAAVRGAARDGESPVVPGERATRGALSAGTAGGPDVERHAAAAARDGKGRRVDGQFRTSVRGLHALTGSGPSIRTKRHRTRSRPRQRPRSADRGCDAAPIPILDDEPHGAAGRHVGHAVACMSGLLRPVARKREKQVTLVRVLSAPVAENRAPGAVFRRREGWPPSRRCRCAGFAWAGDGQPLGRGWVAGNVHADGIEACVRRSGAASSSRSTICAWRPGGYACGRRWRANFGRCRWRQHRRGLPNRPASVPWLSERAAHAETAQGPVGFPDAFLPCLDLPGPPRRLSPWQERGR